MADVNSASVRVKIVVETESAPSRHTVTKNPERIRSFQRVTNEASRIFSGKEKRNTQNTFLHYEDSNVSSIKFYRRRQIPTNLQSVITTYYWNVNSLETLSTRTIGTSYLQPLGSTLKLLACYSFVAIMQLFGHSRQFSQLTLWNNTFTR